MKVLVVADGQYPPQTLMSGNKAVYELQKRLVIEGLQVHLLTFVERWAQPGWREWFQEQERLFGLHIETIDSALLKRLPKPLWKLAYILPMVRLHREHHFDIVHQYASAPSMLRLAPIYKRLLGTPLVYTFCSYLSGWYGSLRLAGGKTPSIDRIICTSDYIAQGFQGRFPGKVVTLTLGGDLAPFARAVDGGELRKQLDILSEDPVLLYVAPLEEHKGIGVLLDALPAIWESCPRSCMVVVANVRGGNTAAYHTNMQSLLQRTAAHRSQVRVLEGLQDVPSLMAMADVVVIPLTRQQETLGHPLTLLEAMAAGKAVVASEVEGTREVVKDGSNGLLVPPKEPSALAQAVIRLLRDKGLRKRIGARAREDVAGFDISYSAKRLVDIYRAVVKPGVAA